MLHKQHIKIISIIQLILVVISILFLSKLDAQTKEKLPCIDKKFSIIVHVVKDSLGQPTAPIPSIPSEVSGGIAAVNGAFQDICVSFEICEVRYIDNFQYFDLDTATELSEVYVKYHEKNRINLFYINTSSIPGSFASLGGIADLSGGGVFIEKGSGGGVYIHEFGHYFGLLHTFEGAGTPGAELVDGSNCLTAGDGVCDTPADPYPLGAVDDDCRYIGMDLDANGDYYTPDVSNPMTYWPCTCGTFTHDQFWKMANTYLNSNPKMW